MNPHALVLPNRLAELGPRKREAPAILRFDFRLAPTMEISQSLLGCQDVSLVRLGCI